MKVKVYSDLHLETNREVCFHPGEGSVLVLAGDILTAKHLRTDGELGETYKTFIKQCSENYDKVLYVAGNHEHYQYNIFSTHKDIREHLPDNFILMENDTVTIGDWVFIGATLWTDFNNQNASDMFAVKQMINDYRYIRIGKNFRKLLPEDVLKIHLKSRTYIQEQLEKHKDDKVFVITDHLPCEKSIHKRFKGNVSNAAYYSDLSGIIQENPQIKYWVHGHSHTKADYKIGNCRVISNPRGYYLYEEANGFDPDFELEI